MMTMKKKMMMMMVVTMMLVALTLTLNLWLMSWPGGMREAIKQGGGGRQITGSLPATSEVETC